MSIQFLYDLSINWSPIYLFIYFVMTGSIKLIFCKYKSFSLWGLKLLAYYFISEFVKVLSSFGGVSMKLLSNIMWLTLENLNITNRFKIYMK